MERHREIIFTFASILIFAFIGITLIHGQSKWKMGPFQEMGRDPFRLPEGIRLLSNINPVQETKGTASKSETKPPHIPVPLEVKAILISDHVRLASIDGHIVTVGDLIHDERVLEIKFDCVILGKGGKKKTLLLSQSPVHLTVEER
jgi:hypothetical protein